MCKNYCRSSLLLSVLTAVVFVLDSVTMAVAYRNKSVGIDYCMSKQCIKTANQYLNSINESVNPCDNFYDFVCGNWVDEYPEYIDIMSMLNQKISTKYNNIIKENVTKWDSQSVKKVKTMYAACINETERSKVGLKPMFDYLEKIGLPRYPRMLNLSGCLNNTDESEQSFDWIQTMANIKKNLFQGIFLDLTIMVDPWNSSRYILIAAPSANLEANSFVRSYKDPTPNTAKNRLFFCDTISLLLQSQNETSCYNETCNSSSCSKAADVIHNITSRHKEISGILQKTFNWNENLTDSYQLFDNVYELQKYIYQTTPTIELPIFERILKTLFAGITEYTVNLESEKIVMLRKNVDYVRQMIEFLVQQPVEHLELYMWWSSVQSVSPETTKEMYANFFPTLPMAKHCASFIYTLLTPIFAAEKTKNLDYGRVHEMIRLLKKEFVLTLSGVKWMSEETKRQAIAKVEALDSFVGGPKMKDLDVIYGGLTVTNTTHVQNIFGLFELEINRRLKSFKSKYNMLTDIYSSLHSVNAFYYMQSNAVVLPEATLKHPLFDLGLEQLDYGAFGSIIAHEVAHSVDPRSRQFDAKGNLVQWWDDESMAEYNKRVECLINQYNGFEMPAIGQKVNGSKTLHENFCDNVGLSLVYRLFEKSLARFAVDKALPGLAKYTPQQLFFISYGSLCCTTESREFLTWQLKDEHAPMRYRLLGPLQNMPEFVKAFQCRRGSYMNPEPLTGERCSIF